MPASKRSPSARPSSPVCQAILVAAPVVDTPDLAISRSLAELEHLVRGLGMAVIALVVQRRTSRGASAYLGDGKLHELAAMTGGPGPRPRGPDSRGHRQPAVRDDLVVVADDELGPGQLRALESAVGVPVLDRTAVVLRVFESRARSRQARLEVELARLGYELPRIRDDSSLGDREGGGGRASRGHSNVELAKQRSRDRMASVRRELDQLAASADRQRRDRGGVSRVALVGYTNAGKSSLMRQVTGRDVVVEDRLFATLATLVRPLSPPASPPVLVADTVGFLHRLPHALVASFRSTLSEARDAGLLLHVVDAADPAFRDQRAVTDRVLADLGAVATPTWLLLNKIDRLGHDQRAALADEYPDAIQVSALDPRDGAGLRDRIAAWFARDLVEDRLSIPYARQGVLAELRDRIQVLDEDYGETLSITVRAAPDVLRTLHARLARR